MAINKAHLGLLGIFVLVAAWSGIAPHDYFTWKLEVFPAFLGLIAVAATYKRFKFTTLLYVLITLHAVILLVGGHYTYAEVPLFNWLRDEFGFARNHYDRLGHFAQGFIPAMVGRELLLRTSPLKPGKWLFALIVLGCIGISGAYELLEWQVSVNTGEGADAFLGTQGDIWDTQKDMCMAMLGAISALLLLSKTHDKALQDLKA